MADTDPNTDLAASVAKLKKALDKEREAHKATKAQLLAPVRAALGLPDDAPLDSITATLTDRLRDVDAQLAERTAALTAERDAARSEAARLRSERDTERIDAAIRAALAKSGVKPECAEDATTILRGVLEVDGTGAVRTKAAPNTVPGQSVEQYIVSQLRTLRPHYWPTSVGGGSKGGGGVPGVGGDDSCFDPSSPNYNFTRQLAYEARHGAGAADAARRRYGGWHR